MGGFKYNGFFVVIESKESNVAIVDTDSKVKPIWDDTLWLDIGHSNTWVDLNRM